MVLELWTDGSCWPNPGNGTWAFVLVDRESGKIVAERSEFIPGTTNNIMEYTGLIRGIEFIEENGLMKKFRMIRAFSDSRLLVDTINEWIPKWKAANWRRKSGRGSRPVANLGLVKQLDAIRMKYNQLTFQISWVKGHADIKWNEYCDQMCRKEYNKRGMKSFEDLREAGELKWLEKRM